MDNCGTTFTAEYGSENPCELASTDCVIYENAITYLGLEENATLTEVLQALLLSLQDARQRITQLENP